MAKIAKDYLALSATSCVQERAFSAAADICSTARGALSPKTAERLVGSQAWLKAGIVPEGKFAEAIEYVANFKEGITVE